MDRSQFKRSIVENAVRPQKHRFTLPVSGEEFWLIRPNRLQQTELLAAVGDDWMAGAIHMLRIALVDPVDGEPLAESVDELRAWLGTLADDDFQYAIESVMALTDGTTTDDGGVQEDPKAS